MGRYVVLARVVMNPTDIFEQSSSRVQRKTLPYNRRFEKRISGQYTGAVSTGDYTYAIFTKILPEFRPFRIPWNPLFAHTSSVRHSISSDQNVHNPSQGKKDGTLRDEPPPEKTGKHPICSTTCLQRRNNLRLKLLILSCTLGPLEPLNLIPQHES